MHLEIPHTLGKEEAIRRIDQTIAEVEKQSLPAGVVMKNFTKAWTDNVLKIPFGLARACLEERSLRSSPCRMPWC